MILFDKARRFSSHLLKQEFGGREEIGILRFQVAGRHAAVFGLDVDSDAVAARAQRRNHRGARAAERIEDRVPREREHAHEPGGQFQRERCRVVLRGCTGDVPYLLEPAVELLFPNPALVPLPL
jgi:hypothetical protein